MPKPNITRYAMEREMWLTSLDDTRLRMLGKQRGVPEADKLPRAKLVQELMLLGSAANPIFTPKRDRRV